VTLAAPTLPRSPFDQVRRAAIDGWTMTQRDLLHWYTQPSKLLIDLAFPVMLLLMFAYLFGGGMFVSGGGNYRAFLVPGLLAMTMLFRLEGTMLAVTTDAARGVTDRFRSMPMAPSAVLVGRSGADLLRSAIVLAGLMLVGLAIGWRAHGSVAETALAVGLLLLLSLACIWAGIYLGLVMKNPESVMAVQVLVWPFSFLSNAFVAPETMPGWLGTVAEWNPMSSVVSATRELFGNPGVTGGSWVAEHPVLMAAAWSTLLIAIFFPLSVARYRRLDR